jgi:hypothetical protein
MKPPTGEHRYDALVPVADLDERRAAEYLGLSARALQSLRYRGKGPVYYKIGDGPKARVAYRYDDLRTWQRGRVRRIEPGAAAQPAGAVRNTKNV